MLHSHVWLCNMCCYVLCHHSASIDITRVVHDHHRQVQLQQQVTSACVWAEAVSRLGQQAIQEFCAWAPASNICKVCRRECAGSSLSPHHHESMGGFTTSSGSTMSLLCLLSGHWEHAQSLRAGRVCRTRPSSTLKRATTKINDLQKDRQCSARSAYTHSHCNHQQVL